MQLPLDVVDYILGFLKPHSDSLLACSRASPVLARLAQRHLYYHIVVHTGYCYNLRPSSLITLLSQKPHIVHYVRILHLVFDVYDSVIEYMDNVAPILTEFSALACIMLTGRNLWMERISKTLRTAIEHCLRLATLQQIQIKNVCFSLTMLDGHQNINSLCISGDPDFPDRPNGTQPQLRSLSVRRINDFPFFITWAKQHILKLESLQCDYSKISALLEVCSDTLINLDLSLIDQSPYYVSNVMTGQVLPCTNLESSIKFSSLPRLRHLTVRVDAVYASSGHWSSCLPAAIGILKAATGLHHITIDIDLFFFPSLQSISKAIFSLFAALPEFSTSCHRIDLYIHSSKSEIACPETDGLLAEFGGLAKLIEQRVLVIHTAETALGMFDIVQYC